MLVLARDGLTTILFHRFFFEGEALERGRDRLKRQCEWLRNHFSVLKLSGATAALEANNLPPKSLLVTIDDAKVELLRVVDIFSSFELPVSIFACVGWCAREAPDEGSLLARVVERLEWYSGPNRTVATKLRELEVSSDAALKRETIDFLLSHADELNADLEAVLQTVSDAVPVDRVSCSWDELTDLRALGAEIGGHSVSHVKLGAASTIRMKFEIAETGRILREKFGSCDVFAYPYGMAGTYNEQTTRELKDSGFRFAFLTHSDIATPQTSPFHLPRISMPDRPMIFPEFCLRAAGAGIVYRRLKQSGLIRSRN